MLDITTGKLALSLREEFTSPHTHLGKMALPLTIGVHLTWEAHPDVQDAGELSLRA